MKNTCIFLALAAASMPSMSLGMRSSKVALALEGKNPMCRAALCLSYAAWFEAHLLSQNEKLISGELRLSHDLLAKKVEPVAFQEWRVQFLEKALADNKRQWQLANAAYVDGLLHKDEQKRD